MRSSQYIAAPSSRPSSSGLVPSRVGSGPSSGATPVGRVKDMTAASRSSAASAATCPGRGPKPARHASRSACAGPNFPP